MDSKGVGLMAAEHVRVAGDSETAASHDGASLTAHPDIAGRVVPGVRVTGILVEEGKILLVKQVVQGGKRTHWNLPGGMLELGETLEQALMREMMEETGLEVRVGELLYVSDRFRSLGHHIVDMSFVLERVGGELLDRSVSDNGREVLSRIEMVPVTSLVEYGFSERFQDVVGRGLPNRGSYVGNFHSFY